MNKYVLSLFVFLILLSSCSSRKPIKSSKNIFLEVAYNYQLQTSRIIYKSRDSSYNLSNAVILSNGIMKAELKSGMGQKIIFYSMYPSKGSIGRITDSIGKKYILVSDENISKVIIRPKGHEKRVVYERHLLLNIIANAFGLLLLLIIILAFIWPPLS